MLDMIANINKNGWKRPIYFSTTLGPSNYLNLKDHMLLEGLAYRLLPAKHGDRNGDINTEKMYENMMTKFKWRQMDNPSVFYDENYKRFVFNARFQYYILSAQLLNEGKREKAKEVVNYCLTILPDNTFPYDEYSTQFIPLLFELKEEKKAFDMSILMGDRAIEMLDYMMETNQLSSDAIRRKAFVLQTIASELNKNGYTEEAEKYTNELKSLQQIR